MIDPFADSRLAAIVESSFDAIISKDLNSIIRSWNGAAERMFGYTAEEAVGQSILMLIPDHLRSQEDEIITRIRAGERIASFETVRRRKNGSPIFVSLTISPIKDDEGRIVGASKIARDITAAKESERRIKILMREVNHRVKNQFAVILSMIREIGRQTDDPAIFQERVRERIMALSRSHDLLVNSEWMGASIIDLVREHLKPFGHSLQIKLSGSLLSLKANAVQNIGMALHELGTNSAKYGALSSAQGSVVVHWSIRTCASGRPQFQLTWEETFPPTAEPIPLSERKGFGTLVLQRVTPRSLMGTAETERTPESLRWSLTAPLTSVVMPADDFDAMD